MADGVEFSILGLEGLLGKLATVSVDVRHKGGRAALRKAAQVVVQWLNWQLRADPAARRAFVGADCGLCKDPAWKLQTKGLE